MNYRKQGLKALGLSLLAALGLMAFTAAGAQANGKILVEGLAAPFLAPLTGTAENTLPVGTKLEGNLLILKLNAAIFCHAGTATGTVKDTGHGHVEIIFTGCLVQGVKNDGTDTLIGEPCATDLNIVAKALALVILHSGNVALFVDQTPLTANPEHKEGTGNPYILFTPLDGLTFATLEDHAGCLPLKTEVKGCVVAEIKNPGLDEVTKLITTKAMLSLFGCKLLFGANESHLNIDANVKINNKSWGAS